jgi:metal-responsive CopG/Arc/MetJ family transcriptional regulator
METISIKLEEDFLRTVTTIMKKHNYTTKAEFIREAIREKVYLLEKKEHLLCALKTYGAGKKKHTISKKNEKRARELAVKELEKELE